MNKKLEEAINFFKEKINALNKHIKNYQLQDCETATCNQLIKEREALTTLLNYIENSIPTSVVEKYLEEYKIIAEKADKIPTTVEEERINGDIVYSQRFNADGYIAQIVVKVLQELLQEKGDK